MCPCFVRNGVIVSNRHGKNHGKNPTCAPTSFIFNRSAPERLCALTRPCEVRPPPHLACTTYGFTPYAPFVRRHRARSVQRASFRIRRGRSRRRRPSRCSCARRHHDDGRSRARGRGRRRLQNFAYRTLENGLVGGGADARSRLFALDRVSNSGDFGALRAIDGRCFWALLIVLSLLSRFFFTAISASVFLNRVRR